MCRILLPARTAADTANTNPRAVIVSAKGNTTNAPETWLPTPPRAKPTKNRIRPSTASLRGEPKLIPLPIDEDDCIALLASALALWSYAFAPILAQTKYDKLRL